MMMLLPIIHNHNHAYGALLQPHMHLNTAHAQSFLRRYEIPRVGDIGGAVVMRRRISTLDDIQKLSGAHALLDAGAANGAIISSRETCYMCSAGDAMTTIMGVVWWRETDERQKTLALAALQQWHRVTLSDVALTHKLCGRDKELWNRAGAMLGSPPP